MKQISIILVFLVLATGAIEAKIVKKNTRKQTVKNEKKVKVNNPVPVYKDSTIFEGWGQKCYQKAMKGDADGQYLLAECYFFGWGAKKSYSNAFKWAMKAARQGHPGGSYYVARAYEKADTATTKQLDLEGLTVDEWYQKAYEQAEPLVVKGNPVAQYVSGVLFSWGICGRHDNPAKWFIKAAEQGYAPAQNDLGRAYHNGWWSCPKDDEQAKKWLLKAANQDFPPACYNYYHFNLAPYNERFKWLKRSADQGDPSALNEMCDYYYNNTFYTSSNDLRNKARTDKKALSDLVERLEKLEYYIKFAKQQGETWSTKYLYSIYGEVAEIYEKGIFGEMPKDYKKALYYYRLANKYDKGTSRPYEKHIKRILELLNESNEEK